LPIDDPSPAIAGAGQAPAMVHLLPMNRHLHKTSGSRLICNAQRSEQTRESALNQRCRADSRLKPGRFANPI
ncbi:hypothetical protein, partial [Aquibaculum sediminis]|uniref:hypothetical protein n=1 Tax=Aquibaculum sediminis TaxID=3231907 RepID=UPI00345609D0